MRDGERPAPCRGESRESAGRDDGPDFRHRLERHGLAHLPFGDRLAERGVLLKKGGIVDATIISAPSSTGNESNARDPEMHRTKKRNQWHFGMKLHVGTDPRGLVHHLEETAISVAT